MTDFEPFGKMARLNRDCVITEKLDGTNAQIVIDQDGNIRVGSRTRWITPGKTTDNYGFAGWVERNREEILKLGEGKHFGEWYGNGIQCGYGLNEKRFALFNVHRWKDNPDLPSCCEVVPVLYEGPFDTVMINDVLNGLRINGSTAVPGFMKPEGIVVYHKAANQLFKVTLENDNTPKSLVA